MNAGQNMSEKTFRYFILTGPPEIGKTTAIKKVCNILKEKGIAVNGFYTEDVRLEGERIGFDVVTTSGKRAQFARIKGNSRTGGLLVGNYVVWVYFLETLVFPVLQSHDEKSILLIDEIGKMETLSKGFIKMVSNFLEDKKTLIVATVPVRTDRPIPLVEKLKNHPDAIWFSVDQENRNTLPDEIVNYIVDAKNKESHSTE